MKPQALLWLMAFSFWADSSRLVAEDAPADRSIPTLSAIQSASTDSDAHRTEQFQAAFLQFPLLNPSTNGVGEPTFQTITLTNPVAIDGTAYYGFRFQVPRREKHEDFVWTFAAPKDWIHWYIVPATGRMEGFKDFDERPRGNYMGAEILFPRGGKRFYLQNLSGTSIQDGETYLIWLKFDGQKPTHLSLTFSFTDMAKAGKNRFAAMEKLFGLNRPASQPFVNPANGHTYILLRSATWKKSEAQAVAMGGHLATVRNQAEEDWLLQTFGRLGGAPRLLWIGLNDTANKFHFGWSSGESVSYTCWAKGEPNNVGRGEDFVAIFYPGHDQGGKWNDWNDRAKDPIGLPMNGVVEIVSPEAARVATPVKTAKASTGANATSTSANSISATQSVANSTSEAMVVEIRPSIIVTNDSGSIRLQWPVSAVNYMLETTTNMAKPFTMFGYSERTNVEAGVVYTTITNPVPQMFFRLRRP
ncbi:MAG: Lectin C-type domain protein [Verrucomicrobiales bacterium]|nr:Lectin C-type domain protein [Verrucomicrobiales bacterium]